MGLLKPTIYLQGSFSQTRAIERIFTANFATRDAGDRNLFIQSRPFSHDGRRAISGKHVGHGQNYSDFQREGCLKA